MVEPITKDWKVGHIGRSEIYVDTIDEVEIAQVSNADYLNGIKNAHLIAAAPELLKELENHCNKCFEDAEHRNINLTCGGCSTKKAIQKAKGGELQ